MKMLGPPLSTKAAETRGMLKFATEVAQEFAEQLGDEGKYLVRAGGLCAMLQMEHKHCGWVHVFLLVCFQVPG